MPKIKHVKTKAKDYSYCECGKEITNRKLTTHYRSKSHINFLMNKYKIETNIEETFDNISYNISESDSKSDSDSDVSELHISKDECLKWIHKNIGKKSKNGRKYAGFSQNYIIKIYNFYKNGISIN